MERGVVRLSTGQEFKPFPIFSTKNFTQKVVGFNVETYCHRQSSSASICENANVCKVCHEALVMLT